MTPKELGKLLGVDARTLKNWVAKGYLTDPPRTLGGHKRFDPKQVAGDLARSGISVSSRLLAFIDAHSPEADKRRVIASASTEQLRAELERREAAKGVALVNIPVVYIPRLRDGSDPEELSRMISEIFAAVVDGPELARREERGAA